MKVWIDQRECMGAGTCEQIAPEVFVADGGGTWCVREDARFFGTDTAFDGGSGAGHGPAGPGGLARVPVHLEEAVIEVAEQCPGECVHVEV
jgi:ferredoxin